jgi:pentatricopeptide repeat protein
MVSMAAAQRAQDLLSIMEELAEAGNTSVQPDVYSYTTVIQAWARCRQSDKAQAILQQMTSRGLQPNRLTYTALMSSLAKSGRPDQAYEILQDMMESYEKGGFEELKPDTVAFSCIIDGWARVSGADQPEAATRALELLQTMKQRAADGMGPNAQTYTSVLTAIAKSGTHDACDLAIEILQEMEDEYYRHQQSGGGASMRVKHNQDQDAESKNWSIRPTNIQYNCVLNAIARSPRADKAIKAKILLQQMQEHSHCQPDTISYNSVLMAAAGAYGNQALKQSSFEIALQAFKAVVSNNNKNGGVNSIRLQPTSTTFATFAKASRRLLSPGKAKSALGKTLQLTCQMGMLNHIVVYQAKLACKSEAEWKDLAGDLADFIDWNVDFRDCKRVPKEWTCNARR